jgi:hypothetical protein
MLVTLESGSRSICDIYLITSSLSFNTPRARIILGLFMKFTVDKITHPILGQNEGLYEVCKFVEVFNHSKSSSEYQYVYNFSKLYVLLS